mmetsp:Transcript_7538/g.18536  ORF Transcript_7538/g.18536 Transcript_7538/m.18536 type:complete len:1263 (+) Transcript_7538:1-3789(+)
MDSEELWQLAQSNGSDWSVSFALALISGHHSQTTEYSGPADEILRNCESLCRLSQTFSEAVLPYLICDTICAAGTTFVADTFSSKFEESLLLCEGAADRTAVRVIIAALELLRAAQIEKTLEMQTTVKQKSSRSQEKVYKLNVDYIVAAKAAFEVAANFSALLFAEYARENLLLDDLNHSSEEKMASLNGIVFGALENINDPDSIYGVSRTQKSDELDWFEGKWERALYSCDASLVQSSDSVASSKLQGSVVKSLSGMGLLHAPLTYGIACGDENEFIRDQMFEAAWKLKRWDFEAGEHDSKNSGLKFHSRLFSALKSCHDGEKHASLRTVELTRDEIVGKFGIQQGSTKPVVIAALELKILGDIESFASCSNNVDQTLQGWQKEEEHTGVFSRIAVDEQSFAMVQSLLWARFLLSDLNKRQTGQANRVACLTDIILSRNRIPQAKHALSVLQVAESALNAPEFFQGARYELQRAKILYCSESSSKIEALRVLNSVLAKLGWSRDRTEWSNPQGNSCDTTERRKMLADLRGESCRLGAEWNTALFTLDKDSSYDMYLLKGKSAYEMVASGTALKEFSVGEGSCEMAYTIASYAEQAHMKIESRLTSKEFRIKENLRMRKQEELEKYPVAISRAQGQKAVLKDLRYHKWQLEKDIVEALEEKKSTVEDSEGWLGIALSEYGSALQRGNTHDVQAAFRMLSLWLKNSTSDAVNKIVKSFELQPGCFCIPVVKFFPLLYQLASRLEGGDNAFQALLKSLLFSMAQAISQPTLWQLMALANGANVEGQAKHSSESHMVNDDKIAAAESLIQRLRASHSDLIDQMQKLSEAYIELAAHPVPKLKANATLNLGNLKFAKLRNLACSLVHVPTAPVCFAGDVPALVSHFEVKVRFVGGVNAPKVVKCIDQRGNVHKQLVKGNDDLRQDAVMEQLFEIVNLLLKSDAECAQRRLGIRTYRVVPLSPCTGVVEWVINTSPLSAILFGDGVGEGVHARYRPLDLPHWDCRKKMADSKDKFATFTTVCERFKPALRHFFYEKFRNPAEWFSKRLAYTRSVAVTSAVGFIIGLGDRHSSNILMDTQTAEVVHIDLGIAFEQGKLLRQPEQVPFRLTRDIVDGMGGCVGDVEGSFKRCMELTLQLLRDQKHVLLTVIEVFLHDPLFKWALSPLKAMMLRRHDDSDKLEELDITESQALNPPQEVFDKEYGFTAAEQTMLTGNESAAQALLRIREKLQGYQDGEVLTVETHVKYLIHEAMNPQGLCLMFEGWAAWA